VEGTFSLELIHMFNADRGPDIVLTFPWSSSKNGFGVPGTDYSNTTQATGPTKGSVSNHGSMSSWDVRNTFIGWGVDFKRGSLIRVTGRNVNITTLLALKKELPTPRPGRSCATSSEQGRMRNPAQTRIIRRRRPMVSTRQSSR
jgi:hypothetical protein